MNDTNGSRKLLVFLILVLAFNTSNALADNYFVQSDASGDRSGRDFINAWPDLTYINATNVHCGDTVYIASSTMTDFVTDLTYSAICTASTPVNIRRATHNDAAVTSAAGWNPSLMEHYTIRVFGKLDIPGPAAYIYLDGRPGGHRQHGIGFYPSRSNGFDADESGPVSHLKIKNVEIAPEDSNARVGISMVTYGSDHVEFNNVYVHGFATDVAGANWDNNIIQNSTICNGGLRDGSSGGLASFSAPFSNNVVRNNHLCSSSVNGVVLSGSSFNFRLYGNVFSGSSGQLLGIGAGYHGSVQIFNNIFHTDPNIDAVTGYITWAAGVRGEFANNIMDGGVYNVGRPPYPNHNAYSGSNIHDRGVGSFHYDYHPKNFTGFAGSYFHLSAIGASIFNSGKALPAPFNVDGSGVTRGYDGPWSIGAFQY